MRSVAIRTMWELMCDRTERAVAEILNTTKNRIDFGFLWGFWFFCGDYCGVGGSLSRYFWGSERLFRGLHRGSVGHFEPTGKLLV